MARLLGLGAGWLGVQVLLRAHGAAEETAVAVPARPRCACTHCARRAA
jgi:hypothetical protein